MKDEIVVFHDLSREELKKLLTICTQESHFQFNGQYYDQVDGVAMGSPLGPLFANVFMSNFERKHMQAFKEQGIDDVAVFKKIEDIIIKTILSAENVMFNACNQYVPFPRTNCFELLGFDILIDNMLNPWLLEVNLSPSLACDSPLDQRIKGNLISDLFSLSGIVPLDQRKNITATTTEGIYGRPKGMYYGMY